MMKYSNSTNFMNQEFDLQNITDVDGNDRM